MRTWLLIVGPVVLVSGSYAVTWWRPPSADAAQREKLVDEQHRYEQEHARQSLSLSEACQTASTILTARPELAGFTILVRPPFILAANLPAHELERLHDQALAPLTAALERAYFDHLPQYPIRVILLRDEPEYRRVAKSLDGYDPLNYDGYFQRQERRLVVNLGTGLGTLSHELCHAYAQSDFPQLPEWIDEGLAALHEETRFNDDRLLLTGLPNWRCRILADAFAAGELPTIEQIATVPSIRGRHEGLNYAYARSFCRFLQERDLLSHFYRKLRSARGADPTGLPTLRRLLGVPTNADVDELFRRWLLTSAASK